MTRETTILVDAHVHGHSCFRMAGVFEAADAGFAGARTRSGLPRQGQDVLLLAEGAGENFFGRCRERLGSDAAAPWTIAPTDERASLRVERPGRPPLTLVAGRQVATADGIELIGVGVQDGPPDGAPARETLAALREAGAAVIVPWGFGKWSGRRGRLVRTLVETARPGTLAVGDNGGRSGLLPRPALLAVAESRGLADLPGSDPLPFPAHVKRIGTRGFLLDAPLDGTRPAADLLARIAALTTSPPDYGPGRSFVGFVADQVRMQVRKRIRRAR